MSMHKLLQEKDKEFEKIKRQIVENDQEVMRWKRISHIVEDLKIFHDSTTPSHEEYELRPLEEKLQVIKIQIQHDK